MFAPVLLAACIAIEGERILVSDLARALPAFAKAAGEEEIGIAPSPGVRRLMGRRELEREAARFGVELPAESSVCFERAAEPLTEARVLEALKPALKGERGTWELLEFSRLPAPKGGLEFLAPVRSAADAPVVVRGRVLYPPNRSYPVWARIRITRPPREVERGAMVDVEVVSGGAVLKFQARAESGGETGETVLLRNLTTKTCFSARVAGSGKATVDANNDNKSARARARGGLGEPGR
ncbi:MAG TPA: flagella basal body P-ring formation protein FlgA [Bryobacteraceae bacterium]